MFARGETEEKMGAGFPLVECQQFLPRPKLPPPAQASAAHKIPEKEAFFSSKLDFLFLRWKISALPLLDPLPVKSLRNEKAFTKTAVSLLIEMSVKKSLETAMVKSNNKKPSMVLPPTPQN